MGEWLPDTWQEWMAIAAIVILLIDRIEFRIRERRKRRENDGHRNPTVPR